MSFLLTSNGYRRDNIGNNGKLSTVSIHNRSDYISLLSILVMTFPIVLFSLGPGGYREQKEGKIFLSEIILLIFVLCLSFCFFVYVSF